MKKQRHFSAVRGLSLLLVLALLAGFQVPVLAVDSSAEGLTPQIAKAYLDVVDNLIAVYGGVRKNNDWQGYHDSDYYGMCGGYVVPMGGTAPSMVVAYCAPYSSSYDADLQGASIAVYTWDGSAAVCVFEQKQMTSPRSFRSFELYHAGAIYYLREQWYGEQLLEISGDRYYRVTGAELTETAAPGTGTSIELSNNMSISISNQAELRQGLLPLATYQAPVVVLSPQNLTVDQVAKDVEKYNIDGRNYFKLRDLAYMLTGTGSQFQVGYDQASQTVRITRGSAYTPDGSEMRTGLDRSATAQVSAQSILIDGVLHSELTVYNIGGNNFFQLRELGDVLGFEVDYNAQTNTAIVNSRETAVLDDSEIPAEELTRGYFADEARGVIFQFDILSGQLVLAADGGPEMHKMSGNDYTCVINHGANTIIFSFFRSGDDIIMYWLDNDVEQAPITMTRF